MESLKNSLSRWWTTHITGEPNTHKDYVSQPEDHNTEPDLPELEVPDIYEAGTPAVDIISDQATNTLLGVITQTLWHIVKQLPETEENKPD